MKQTIISTSDAPAAIGPYSQGIVSEGFLYTAGQVGLDPASGKLISGGIREEATRALENLKAVLSKAGIGFGDVVKTTVYLVSMDDFPALNEVYAQYFGEWKPARTTVAVAALPKGARVEIDLIARL